MVTIEASTLRIIVYEEINEPTLMKGFSGFRCARVLLPGVVADLGRDSYPLCEPLEDCRTVGRTYNLTDRGDEVLQFMRKNGMLSDKKRYGRR